MIFYFDAQGNSLGAVHERIYQGSAKANEIYFVSPVSTANAVTVAFSLASGDTTERYPLMPSSDGLSGVYDGDGNEYAVWTLSVPAAITAVSGETGVQFYITDSAGVTVATQAQYFTVERGVVPTAPDAGDDYDEIFTYLSAVNANVERLLDTYDEISFGNGTGDNSLAQGYDDDGETVRNIASGDSSFAAGSGTSAGEDNQFVIGTYNAADSDALFIVGNGTDSTHKSNAFTVKQDGTVTLSKTPTTASEAATKAYVDTTCYPVGSIYLSVDSTSPASIFGGTWERIQDKFLLAAGSTYSAGDTGGSADAIVPLHNHKGVYYSRVEADRQYVIHSGDDVLTYGGNFTKTVGSGNLSSKVVVGPPSNNSVEIGESATGKNMPPYLAVYVWKRTA